MAEGQQREANAVSGDGQSVIAGAGGGDSGQANTSLNLEGRVKSLLSGLRK